MTRTPADSGHVECILWNGEPLCYIVGRGLNPRQTTFVTPPEASLQVGFILRDAGEEIPRHTHRPVERTIRTTAEVLFVQRGRCRFDLYSDDHQHVATRELREGDLVVIVGGGHGFHILEDTTLLEIKQGPYVADGDKERF